MDLRRLVSIARRWWALLVAGVVVGAGLATTWSNLQPKVFEARTTLIVGQSLSGAGPDFNQLLVSQRLSATYAAVATTRPILYGVISELGLQVSPEQLVKRVRSNAPLDSTLLTLWAQDSNPLQAAAIANQLAAKLIAASPTIQGRDAEFQAAIDAELRATLVQITTSQDRAEVLGGLTDRTPAEDAELVAIDNRLASLRSTYATLLSFSSTGASGLLSVIEPAVAPDEPISPRPLLNTILGALLGLLLAAGVVAFVTSIRDVIRYPEDVYDELGLSTLGTIFRQEGSRTSGELYRLVISLYPRSAAAEAFRTLRTNLEFAEVDAPIRTMLVTSSVPGEGKTVVAANLAVAFAQAGRKVLLVDADFRKPGIHQVLRLPNAKGLSTLLRDAWTEVADLAQGADQENLTVVTTGPLPPSPTELLDSQRMRSLIERMKANADLVIFDSPPLLAVADAAILSSLCDGTLLVVDAERGRRRSMRLSGMALARAGARVLGVAINRVPATAFAGYNTYYSDEPRERAAQKVAS